MKKESVNKFDLEAAFKALDELDIPVVKGIKSHREDLKEKFTRKLTSEVLVEDYYDLGDSGELEQAQEDREAEIAKAKLARIEKIVDLEAESEEDLLPSYVGKVIIQCPQCMTLFYKNQEDIEKSEENPDVVNINETCQHCGNNSGYTLIGKVDQVGEDEAENYDVEDFEEDELNLDFPEGTEEVDPEGTGEGAEEDSEEAVDLNLDLDIEASEEESEEEEEEEVKESLREAVDEDEIEEIEDEEVVEEETVEEEILLNVEGVKDIAAEAGEAVAEVVKENPEVETEEIKEITDEVVDTAISEVETEEEVIEDEASEDEIVEDEEVVEESLTEAVQNKIAFMDLTGSLAKDAEPLYKSQIEKDGFDGEVRSTTDSLMKDVIEAVKSGAEVIFYTCNDDYKYIKELEGNNNFKVVMISKEALTEAVDKELDAKLKAHNEYIEYLKAEIEKAEKSLNSAKNDFVKKSIQSKLDALKADLEEALPEALKDEVVVNDELPTPEESGLEDAAENKEETKESLKESLNEEEVDEALINLNLDARGQSVGIAGGHGGDMGGVTNEEVEKLDEFVGPAITTIAGASVANNLVNKAFEDLETEAKLDEVEAELENSNVEDVLVESPVVDALNELEAELSEGKLPREPQVFDNDGNLIKVKDPEVLKIWSKVIDYAEANNIDFWNDYKVQKQMIDAVCTEDEKKKLSNVEFEDGLVRTAYESLKEAKKDVSDEEFRAMLRNPVFNEDVEEFGVKTQGQYKEVTTEDEAEWEEKTPVSDPKKASAKADENGLNEELPAVPNIPFEKAADRIENAGEELTPEEEKIEAEELADLENIEEFEEESFNECVTKYLKEVYSNVNSFEATACSIKNSNLVVEGLIKFNSGKEKTTKFVFENNSKSLKGHNKDLTESCAFELNYKVKQNKLITESLKYSYTIDNNLVEGLTR